jgi:hypothetical protein
MTAREEILRAVKQAALSARSVLLGHGYQAASVA